MKALSWYGTRDVRLVDVQEPQILDARDAIVGITSTAICGSDLHIYNGRVSGMESGDILGHEFMGEVLALGSEVENLAVGDRVVVPFAIACGSCFFCKRELWSLCNNSNPNARAARQLFGSSPSGMFGYSHVFGGYAGGQAECVRVPFADVGPLRVPPDVPDSKALFLSDVLPTGYMAAENGAVQPGNTVAVWGCGPVGLLAILSAYMLGAERVIGIDLVPNRLRMAAEHCHAEVIDATQEENIPGHLIDMTDGQGPDCCIDAVGLEAHGGLVGLDDRAEGGDGRRDNLLVLRQAIHACRKGGTVSIPGVYMGHDDQIPLGAAFAKGLTLKMGQTQVHKYMRPLLEFVRDGSIDPSFIITHQMMIDDGPRAYEMFANKEEGCIKVLLVP